MITHSIFQLKDYGKIRFTIKEVMDLKNINRNQLSKLVDVRFEVANKWYNGNIERLDIDVLTKICYALDCEISDLMVYEK